MTGLTIAYGLNIAILVPIAVPTIFRLFPTDDGRFAESEGWRVLVGSLWLAILILSLLGLVWPLLYAPVLLLQLIYKSAWLLVYAAPRASRGDWRSIPWGIAASFLAIVLAWPFLIPWRALMGPG